MRDGKLRSGEKGVHERAGQGKNARESRIHPVRIFALRAEEPALWTSQPGTTAGNCETLHAELQFWLLCKAFEYQSCWQQTTDRLGDRLLTLADSPEEKEPLLF